MALLSKEEHEGLLRRIAETGGATPEMLDDIQKLRDEYDERMGELKRYGEDRDSTGDRERREDSEELGRRDERQERDEWREKYEDLRRKYMDRFFDSGADRAKDEEIEDVKEDSDSKRIDDLFKRKED